MSSKGMQRQFAKQKSVKLDLLSKEMTNLAMYRFVEQSVVVLDNLFVIKKEEMKSPIC